MDWWSPGGTALVVPVPEAEHVVGDFRREHSPSGRDGMIAHVSLLQPLVDWATIAREHLATFREEAARFAPFEVRFARFSRVPAAIALAPEPAGPFARLAEALRAHVLAAAPVPPHLTIASRVADAVLDEIERAVAPSLPITATAREILLYERGDDRRLHVRETIPLGV
jgi:hypothetical protein